MKAHNKCEEEVIKLHEEMKSLVKLHQMKRQKEEFYEDFKAKLLKTMSYWCKNPTSTEEDAKFIEIMSTARVATMGGKDTKTQTTAKKKLKRKAEEQSRIEKEKTRKMESQNVQKIDKIEGTSTTDDISDPRPIHFQVSDNMKHRKIKTGRTLFLPHDILTLETVNSCAIRNKISPKATASFLSSVISGCGGDPEKFHLSYGYSYG